MNKYLEKISKEVENKSWYVKNSIPGLIAGNVAAGVAFGVPQLSTVNKVRSMISDDHSHADLGTIKKMMRDNKLNTSFNTRSHYVDKHVKGTSPFANANHVKNMHSPAFAPTGHVHKGDKNFIVGVKRKDFSFDGNTIKTKTKIANKDVIMHELGHAKDFATYGKFKAHTLVGSRLAGLAAPLMLTNEKTKDYAVPTAALATIPTLRAEAAANYHAYKGIQAHKGTAAARAFAKKLLPAQMGSYGLSAAGSVAGVWAGKKIIDHLNKKTGK